MMKDVCLHCRTRTISRPRGLCWSCYYTPEIKAQYAKEYADALHDDPDYREPRRRGEPRHRCLWCGKWRCKGPLEKCQDCEREYAAMAVGMPVKGVTDDGC